MSTAYAFLLIAVPLVVAATALAIGYVGIRHLVVELSRPPEGQESTEP